MRGEEDGEQPDAGLPLAERGEEGDGDDTPGNDEARQRRDPTHHVHLGGAGGFPLIYVQDLQRIQGDPKFITMIFIFQQ